MTTPAKPTKEALLPMFVLSDLDDYGLTPSQFRVYGHLVRRAGKTGRAWSAVKNMAHICKLHPNTVRRALKTLVSHHLIQAEPRTGETTLYTLLPLSQWQPPACDPNNRKPCDTLVSDCAAPTDKPIQSHPCQSDADKGSPSEGNPAKVFPHSPPKGDRLKGASSSLSQEEQIYEAYPKKVGKPVALRAIRRALVKQAFDFLLERTRLYAQTCNSPPEFIPNPSTWFNQERFNDDPATWRRTAGTGGKSQPTIIRPDKFGCGVSKL